MKKYFGILNNEEVTTLEVEELLDYYIENELFYVSHSYSIDKIGIENPKIDLKPTQEVINAFYDYLTKELSRNINRQFLLFFSDFNDKIYGLGSKEQQKIALKQFNKLYKKIKVLEASFVKRQKDANGIEQVQNMNRFDFLKGRQIAEKQQVATTENILEFLNGNEAYFNREQFHSNPNTKQFIAFEANLKILISLNGQYKFEEDFHFTDLAKLKNLYNKYRNTFSTFEVFIYTHKKIHSFTEAKIAHVTSLNEALTEMKLIQNNNSFLNYLNLEYQMELTKLKVYEPEQNKQHDQRVQKYKLELPEYSTEDLELVQDIEKPKIVKTNKKCLKTFTDKDAMDYLLKNTFSCK